MVDGLGGMDPPAVKRDAAGAQEARQSPPSSRRACARHLRLRARLKRRIATNRTSTDRRLCTQSELDAMCRTGIELVHEAIDSGSPDLAVEIYTKVETTRSSLAAIFTSWTASTLAFVLTHHGEDGLVSALDPEGWLELGLRIDTTLDEAILARKIFSGSEEAAERVRELVTAGDSLGAKAHWDEVEQATLKLHDYRVDWLTAVLSHVYRTYGVDGLRDALLHAAQQEWWRGRMVQDLQNDPVTRVAEWAFFLGVGNFGLVSVTENDDCFVIHHKICGSCGRQELAHRYHPPWNFPRVTEPVLGVNFGDPNFTIYRTHLPVMHFVMPIREIGQPWPAIDCSGIPGRCWFVIYKDPENTPGRYYEKVGLRRPQNRTASR